VHDVMVVPPAFVRAQIDAVLADVSVDAVKTGMLGSAAVVAAVADALAAHRVRRLVVDPVLHASGGRPLLGRGGAQALLQRLVPLAEVVTPNLAEASVLVGFPVRDVRAMEAAARALVAAGARAAVVTGGHLGGDPVDVALVDGVVHRLRAARIAGRSPHGTGCTFAATIAAERAKDVPLADAIRIAKRYTRACIRRAFQLGHGRSILAHGSGPR
jgi:hydroxymethylpyrimidine/phosphomethylpyrimidine kinase